MILFLHLWQAEERLIKPAVQGLENVLMSALFTETLEKVVVTSSVAAVAGSIEKMPPKYLYSEADWNEVATDTYLPYNRYCPFDSSADFYSPFGKLESQVALGICLSAV